MCIIIRSSKCNMILLMTFTNYVQCTRALLDGWSRSVACIALLLKMQCTFCVSETYCLVLLLAVYQIVITPFMDLIRPSENWLLCYHDDPRIWLIAVNVTSFRFNVHLGLNLYKIQFNASPFVLNTNMLLYFLNFPIATQN